MLATMCCTMPKYLSLHSFYTSIATSYISTNAFYVLMCLSLPFISHSFIFSFLFSKYFFPAQTHFIQKNSAEHIIIAEKPLTNSSAVGRIVGGALMFL